MMRLCALAFVALVVCACSQRMKDGVYNISGAGAGTARDDITTLSRALLAAVKTNDSPPPSIWEAVLPDETADIIHWVDAERILVGIFQIDGDLGAPSHGPVQLVDARSGKIVWQATRRSFPNGQYAVLSTDRAIVMLGGDGADAELLALDPGSGARRWGNTMKGPYRVAMTRDGERLILSSTEGNRRRIQAIALATGAVAWTTDLDGTWFDPKGPAALHVADDAAFVAGRRLAKLGLAGGQLAWAADHPALQAPDATVMIEQSGIVVWNANTVALLQASDGRVRWSAAPSGRAKLVSLHEQRFVRVASAQAGADSIQALDANSGRLLWAQDAGGVVVSPVASAPDLILYSTDEALMALDLASGNRRFKSELPPSLVLGRPMSKFPSALPDQLRVRAQKLYVARDSRGIVAYELPTGKQLWTQNSPGSPYSWPGLFDQVQAATKPAAGGGQKVPAAVAPPTLSSPGPNVALRTAQSNYDTARSQYQSTQSSPTASASERSSARGRFLSSSNALETQERVAAASARSQATTQAITTAGFAAVDALAAAKYARDATRTALVVERMRMRLTAAHYLWQNSFREDFYVQSFGGMDRGVMLVNLDTGMRSDIVFALLNGLEQNLGVDFQNFAFDGEGKRLIAAGLSLNADRWQEEVKWRTRRPRPSLLAYDVSGVKFEQVTRRQAASMKAAEETAAMRRQSMNDLIMRLMDHDTEAVRRLLKAGANANQRNAFGVTAITIAANLEDEELVRLLLQHGADPSIRDAFGRNAHDAAKNHRTSTIRDMLLRAKPPAK